MFKHKNFSGNGFGSKPYVSKQRNVRQYRGSIHTDIKSENFVENPAFQINRFKDCINLRFNTTFLTQLLELTDRETQDSIMNGLLHDLEDLLSPNPNDECFVSECYHVGKVGKCIYLNMNNDCGLRFYEILNKLHSFPTFLLAFKQRLEKICLQSKNYAKEKEFEENYNYDE